ncbi:MAG: tetratricopeptide repeat protein [Solirubrobacteraceae bacterium]|nr:tetratricopeptide repeat protein [Solirubrobacteraceae bacterium]
MSDLLVDRERELARLDAALQGARIGAGAAICLRGPAGIGKTTLLDAIADRAPGLVLRAGGGRLERDHPLGAVLELVEPVLDDPAPGIAAAAGPGLIALASGAGAAASILPPADARMTIDHGLRRLLAALGREQPGCLVLVDDVHWLDSASARALAHATRAITDGGVLLVCAARPEAEDDPAARELLRRTEILELTPLSPTGIATLAVRALDQDDAGDLAPSLEAQTGGSPLLVTRLLADLHRAGTPVDAATVRTARPPEIADAVAARLDELGGPATRLAVAAAVLGDETALLRRAAALADLPIDEAARLAARLAAADLLAPGEPLRFAHPLVAAATLDRLPETARTAAHLRAARILDGDGARPAVIAARLLAATPSGEAWAVAALRTAGEEALAQGDPAAAARLLRRVLEEGPDPATRAAIAFPLARAAAFANDPDAAERMEDALACAPNAVAQVAVLLDRGDALVASGRPADARSVLDRALELSGDGDVPPELRAYAVVTAHTAAWVHGRPYETDRSPPPDEQVAAARELVRAATLALTGTGSDDEIAGAAIGGLRTLTGMAYLGSAFLATMALGATDRLDDLAALLTAGAEWADEVGSPLATGSWEGGFGILAGWVGDLDAAVRHSERAIALEAEGWDRHAPAVRATLVNARLDRGDLAAARQVAGHDGAWERRIDHPSFLHARARTQSGDEAIATLRAAGAEAEAIGARSPALLPWRADLALALDRRAPDEALALAEEHLRLADTLGTPRARGVALRTLGLLRRDPETLREAVALVAVSPARLEHARAELALGEVLRRGGHRIDARQHLRSAMLRAETCGAAAVAHRAHEELRAAGGRDRRGAGDGLTPAELRVAELAAAGHSNPEIAETLFLGRRTVEMHLSRAYRKLNITGRGELAAALTARVT